MSDKEKLVELLCDIPVPDQVVGIRVGKGLMAAGYVADYLIANGVTVQKWISVKDRLPDKSATFVAVADAKYYTPVRVVQTNAIMEHMFWGESMGFFAHGVLFTHWMPLPEPPKE